ncbi:MAG: hypothetical protein D6724_08730 [Armatimonadetes bacterium]|nr:MAG: hypothetical protein D6724_08730 [Armatimonadota bacterium]
MRKSNWNWLIVSLVALLSMLLIAPASADIELPYKRGEIVVQLAPGATMADAQQLAQANGMVVKRALRAPGFFLFSLPNPDMPQERVVTEEKLNALRNNPSVRAAQVNVIFEKHQIPDDPLFGPASTQQWNLFQIGLPGPTGAWATEKGRPGIFVVDLDDGFDLDHPDFFDSSGSRLAFGFNTDDGTGFPWPWDPNPGFSHGTMTAGVIVAGTNNGIGMAGVTWQGVVCVPVRIADATGALLLSLILDGYQYVIDFNNNPSTPHLTAQNMSYGSLGRAFVDEPFLQQIAAQGTLLLASAGNSRPFFPAGFPASLPYVTSVAATRFVSPNLEKGFFASYSSQGLPDRSRKVDLAAPSADDTAPVWTLMNGGGYAPEGGGTSYACPTVVGAVALLHSAGMEPSTIIDNLKVTAVVAPGDPVPNVDTGWGEIAVQDAMTLIIPGIKPLEPEPLTTYEYETVSYKFRLFKIRLAGPAPTVTIEKTDGSFGPVVVPSSNYTFTPDPDDPRVVFLEGFARLEDAGGNGEGEWKITVSGTEELPGNTVFTASVIVRVQYHRILPGTSMFSMPYRLDGTSSPPGGRKPESFFSPGFQLFRWIPSLDAEGNPTGAYTAYDPAGPNTQDAGFTPSDPLTGATIIRTTQSGATRIETPQNGPFGVGFFVRTVDETVFDMELGPEDRVLHYRILLKPGWNMIGNPFPYHVDWQSCQIVTVNTRELLSIDQATTRGLIRPQLFRYEIVAPGVKDYRWSSPPRGQLFPFEAHWVWANQEVWLQVNATPSEFRGRSQSEGERVRGNGWMLQLTARQGDLQDSSNFIGATRSVNERYDLVPEAPSQPGGVQLYVLGEDGKAALAQDLRELAAGRLQYKVVVRPAVPNQDVVITWQDVVRPAGRMRLSLKDETTGRVVSMNATSSYTFAADANLTPRTFTITVSPDTAGRLVVGGVRVVSGGRGAEGYTLQYSLSTDANITIRVLSTTGQLVTQLDSAQRTAGTNSIVWNGRNAAGVAVAPGVYMVEITAETLDGERARVTTPITITR